MQRRPLAAVLSVAGHVAAVLALVSVRAEPAKSLDLRLMNVVLMDLRPPADPVTPKAPAEPTPAKAPQQRNIARETPVPLRDVEPLAAGEAETPQSGVELSDSELAGAATAGSGAQSGTCNMPRLLQDALRKDRLVLAAMAAAHRGKAIVVWDGDWLRHPGQEGDGLAAVREALMWEIGFAPEACRAQRVHGRVLLSLNDGPAGARLVVGSGEWRWTDLLFARSAALGEPVARP